MNFPSIDIQGSIISADLLGKIRSEQAVFQQGKDFDKSLNNAKLKDEISLAWQEIKGQWLIFQSKLKRVKVGESAATETRSFWILPLLSNLGYDFQYLKSAEEINGKSFWINNRDNNIGGFPLFIAGFNESLDKRPENRNLRVSPHALVQEYLNYSEHLYGLVTNGKQLRLLRDASRLTRLSYVEFNLEKIMEEDLYSDFVIFYRLLHVSRMPKQQDAGADSILEKYHQEGLEAGATIRNKLGSAVKETIINLATGFINHPDNTLLRAAITEGSPCFNPDEYYRQQLRIIYRLLFLFVIEERNLVYAENKEPQTKRFNQIYYKHYSLLRLRKLAKRLAPPEAARHYDLWMSLVNTFALFENEELGKKMGLMSLKGDLFSYNSIANGNYYDLHTCRLSNAVLMQAIKALGYFENDNKVLIAVNYGGLDVEEFGSVYEGLLELKLKIEPIAGSEYFSCSFDSSTERSSSGSHYTPEELVQPLIKHSLEHIIEDRLKADDPENALLSIKVCDVACGSGHILLSAARKIAHHVACIRETKASNSKERVEQASPFYVRKAMRDTIRNCIYGVDKNPLAVELCKIAFWLEAHNPGEPLYFLDHHIKCGDAIVGLGQASDLQKGIADEAFKALPDDDKSLATMLTKANKYERENRNSKQIKVDFDKNVNLPLAKIWKDFSDFNKLPEHTPDEIEAKQTAYRRLINSDALTQLKYIADIQVAQFFIAKQKTNKDYLVTDADYFSFLKGTKKPSTALLTRNSVVEAGQRRFFHWFLEFPDVFMIPQQTSPKIVPTQQNIYGTAKPQTLMDFNTKNDVFTEGGFDCILGNPPFLGGQRLSGNYGNDYLQYLRTAYAPAGAVDLVTYFFRRIFSIIRPNGFQSLISTNTIAQGGAREGGLDVIRTEGGSINHAVRSMPWPGLAAVEVALVTIFKGEWTKKHVLAGKQVDTITTYLDDSDTVGDPLPLKANENKSFQGSIVLGKGFVLEPHEAEVLIAKNEDNADVIQPYLNGDDLNNDPEQRPSRYVINFRDYPLRRFTLEEWDNLTVFEKKEIEERILEGKFVEIAPPQYLEPVAADYPDCLEIVERLVKPERDKINRAVRRDRWWMFAERATKLYKAIRSLKRTLVVGQVAKYPNFEFTKTNKVLDAKLIVIASDNYAMYSVLQSEIHLNWIIKYATTLETRLNYTPTALFEPFPFPKTTKDTEGVLDTHGKQYHEHRAALMQQMSYGLTKLYNLFHSPATAADATQIATDSTRLDEKAFEKQYGKELHTLRRHLEKSQKAEIFTDILRGIQTLRTQHQTMDEAVLHAYGWTDIALRHGFHEVEYLPENDRTRFTIHPEARKEVLKRLLKLNHERRAEEEAAGLWDKENKKKGKKEIENQKKLF